ncbi:MAG: histidine ammonia-lyase [Candidatus Izemoplasmatales bacterium]|jgi:histidine ammonia-lyase|nr:histidine ammonia-lyase [Candidatus Izemoplasmatales bacterium]
MITINGENLDLKKFKRIVFDYEEVDIDKESQKLVQKARKYIEKVIDGEEAVYGINTGFGKLSDVSIEKKDLAKLQENLLKSHACGVGEVFSEAIVRGMLLLRINALIKGKSGIRLEVILKMVEFLNKRLTPVVFSKGSLGASGDLAPLSHMSLPLIGLGEVIYEGERLNALEGLKRANIEKISCLEAKEGLSLINGTQAMTSVGVIALLEAFNLVNLSMYNLGLTMQALNGIIDVFDNKIHESRNQLGQIEVSKKMLDILNGSKLMSKQCEFRVQDAYSLRCSPQVIGASLDAINYCKDILEREMNAVTDNPIVFVDENQVISAGNFHGQPVALAMDFLGIALAELANISERRLERMVNASLSNGLPPFLVKKPGINSGFMIVQYSAAALVSENKVLAHPASVDSIPSSANQEDHVSMGTIGARKALEIAGNTLDVLTMELFTTLQAIDFKDKSALSPKTKTIYDFVRKEVKFIEDDLVMYHEIHKVKNIINKEEFKELISEVI